MTTLATLPGLVSIVENQEVTTSGGPVCDPSEYHDSGPCAGFGAANSSNGWVSDRQEKKAEVTFSDNIGFGVVSLADGGYVIVAEKNSVTFYNADGSVRAGASALPFEKMKSNPVVGLDGTVFFMGEKPGIASDKPTVYRIYAVDATGKDRWSYDSKDLVPGVALSPDGTYLYVAKVNARIIVLDTDNGKRLYELQPSTEKPGLVTVPPVVGNDGTVYLQTSGKEPDKIDRFTNLLALDPAQFQSDVKAYKWRFLANQNGQLLKSEVAPLVAGDLVLFVSKQKQVIGFNSWDGSQRFSLSLPEEVKIQPVLGANGLIYLTDKKNAYSLTPAGELHTIFAAPVDEYKVAPTLSADSSRLIAAIGATLYSVDTATGTIQWQANLDSEIKSSPFIDNAGAILVGGDNSDLTIFTSDRAQNFPPPLGGRLQPGRDSTRWGEPVGPGRRQEPGDRRLPALHMGWPGRRRTGGSEAGMAVKQYGLHRRGRRCAPRGHAARRGCG